MDGVEKSFGGTKSHQLVRKRRHSELNESNACVVVVSELNTDVCDEADFVAPATKYRELDTAAFRLDRFSDEVLFEIFKHLDSWTLLALMNSCHRFYSFVQDRRFWRNIDLSKEPLPLGMLEGVLERTHAQTETIKLQGPTPEQHVDVEIQQFNKTLVTSFAERSTQLKILELQGVTLDFRLLRIKDFPKTLKRLVLDDCHIRVPEPEVKSIFAEIDTHLLLLEELAIENSDWFEPHYIMIFSKAPSLRWLSLKGCKHLAEFVPYGSMAARFGFKHLEYLDLRFTPITDSDLQCFNAVITLKEILLDCPREGHRLNNAEIHPDEEPSTSSASCSSCLIKKNRKASASICAMKMKRKSSVSCEQHKLFNSSGDSSGPIENSFSVAFNNIEASTSSSSSSIPSSPSSSSSSSSSSPSSSPTNTAPSSPSAQIAPVRNGNMPSHSRFLPRPDQIIYLDVHNRRRPIIMHGPPRRPANNRGENIDQVLMNPIFWDMICPLGRRSRNSVPINNGDENDHEAASRLRRNRSELITDRGVCCFGRPPNPVDDAIIWIRIGYRPNENRFERLSVRNYRQVTDISLQHLVQCSPHLIFLDLSGTGVTRAGVQMFKERKPECQIVVDHLISETNDTNNKDSNLIVPQQ